MTLKFTFDYTRWLYEFAVSCTFAISIMAGIKSQGVRRLDLPHLDCGVLLPCHLSDQQIGVSCCLGSQYAKLLSCVVAALVCLLKNSVYLVHSKVHMQILRERERIQLIFGNSRNKCCEL